MAEAHDANARSAGPDTSLAEFGGLPSRVGLGPTGDARQARLRALLGPRGDTHDDYDLQGYRQPPSSASFESAYQGGNLPDTEYPNLRPARGYEYSYKDPEADGAGRYVGPMAQDLEHLPGVVEQGPDGKKAINAPRLTLANTAAVSEQQRRLDELERQQRLQALGGAYQPSQFARPDLRAPDYASLDQAAGYR